MEQTGTARNALAAGRRVADRIAAHLARLSDKGGRISTSALDEHQLAAYDFASRLCELEAADVTLEYADRHAGSDDAPSLEQQLAWVFAAETLRNLENTLAGRAEEFGLDEAALNEELRSEAVRAFQRRWLSAAAYDRIAEEMNAAGHAGAYGLGEEHRMLQESFRMFAEDKVKPLAEEVHREDRLIPEEVIEGLREMGCFGLCIPEEYEGFQSDNLGTMVVTEELSRASLGVAGSLITRPEILSKALLKGGTEEQKKRWLPPIAAGEKMVAVAVTEPDFGSDVAGMKLAARPDGDGYRLHGAKSWCTFAGRANVLLVLARTDPDPAKGHKGLSIFVVEKPAFTGHEFEHQNPDGGTISGRAIDTIGYRGMHSYEVFFDDYYVPAENLVGGPEGAGRGFYLQMEGFAGGRLQTAARAVGVMQAALEAAQTYAAGRKVFGKAVADYQLTRYKLARMAAIVQASRQFTYYSARMMDEGQGSRTASMVKLYTSRIAEWVTREAQQIHGGMGYAEEFDVSRYFVDARVFSIFEGAEEILALRVIARQVLAEVLSSAA